MGVGLWSLTMRIVRHNNSDKSGGLFLCSRPLFLEQGRMTTFEVAQLALRGRQKCLRALLAVLLLALVTVAARADDVTEIPGLMRQTLSLPATDQAAQSLEALVIRPEGRGPFPLALITHGLPRSSAEVPLMRPQTYTSPAIGFAQRGFASVIVMRRGYGHSTGVFSETLGPCDDRNYVRAGQTAATDVLAALADLRQESWVDSTRVILVGHSMGGFAVLAAVAGNAPDGVLGVISFAGAVGSPRPDFICQPDRLIEANRIFGLTARIPSLWIFAENDHYFGPKLTLDLWEAYGIRWLRVLTFP